MAVESILEKVDKQTCLLAFNHASNITGAVQDVPLVVEEARGIKPDLYVMVDGVQYTPHARMAVEDWGVDGYFLSPYKVYCVKGIGIAYLSERLATLPHWKLPGKPENDWLIGSPGHQMYAAFTAMVDYLCWLGSHFTESHDRRTLIVEAKKRIEEHVKALLKRVLYGTQEVEGLLSMDHVKFPQLGEISRRLCVVPFNLRGMNAKEGVGRYEANYGIRLCARVKDAYSKDILEAVGIPDAVRLSACHYNTPEEVDVFLKATASFG